MEVSLRPSWRQLDLEALDHNVCALQEASGGAGILGVVKADAYGHDAPTVARRLERDVAIHGLVVVGLDEALALLEAGIDGRILVLCGGVAPSHEALAKLASSGLTPVLSSRRQVDGAAELEWFDGVHLLVDTGMARLGVGLNEVEDCVRELSEACIDLRGIATHFVESECAGSPFTAEQMDRYAFAASRVWSFFPQARPHVANSAASLHWQTESAEWRQRHPELALALDDPQRHLVRPGGALYGVDLSEYVGAGEQAPRSVSPVKPVLSLGCQIVQRRSLPEGATVGYGALWRAERPSQIALLPIGYADGVPGHLDDAAHVDIGGARAPIVGAVSMDLLTVDVTDLDPATAAVGSEAWLLHPLGPSLEDWVRWSGRKPYELLCGWSRRVPLRSA
ncbi:MAG: alanine racemase [Acidobacteriota bacterium]